MLRAFAMVQTHGAHVTAPLRGRCCSASYIFALRRSASRPLPHSCCTSRPRELSTTPTPADAKRPARVELPFRSRAVLRRAILRRAVLRQSRCSTVIAIPNHAIRPRTDAWRHELTAEDYTAVSQQRLLRVVPFCVKAVARQLLQFQTTRPFLRIDACGRAPTAEGLSTAVLHRTVLRQSRSV